MMCTQKSYTKILADNRGADQISAVKKILCTQKSYIKTFADTRGADQKSSQINNVYTKKLYKNFSRQ